jgi:hypothetical protein
MGTELEEKLKSYIEGRAPVKSPVNPDVFKFIPFFEEVFAKNLWPYLAKLAGNSGIPHIEVKIIPPKQPIIKEGEFDMMVYWLLKGAAVVKGDVGGKNTIVKRYDRVGHCFGEMAIIGEEARTASVTACTDNGATIMEVDWSITEIDKELERNFNRLLLKTVNSKLMDSYNTTKLAYRALVKVKHVSEMQYRDILSLKEGLAKAGIDHATEASHDLTKSISDITEKLDDEIMRS